MAPLRSLTLDAIRGVGWTWSSGLAVLVVQLIYTSVMSRLLDASAFGLVAASAVGLRFIGQVSKFGIGNAMIQWESVERADLRVATTLSIAIGTAAAGVAFVAAPLVAGVVNVGGATSVMRWLALGLVVAGAGAIPEALLRRSMRFRALSVCSLFSFSVGYLGVGIVGASLGWGVWSLVAAALTQGLLMAVLTSWFARPFPVPAYDGNRARRILAFGGTVSLTGFLEFISSNLDTFAVGRWVGAAPLGQYSRATYLVGLPVEQMSVSAAAVLLPSLSQVQSDPARFRRGFLTCLSALSFVVLVPVAVLAAASPGIVQLVLGPGWEQAGLVLPIVGGAYGLALLSHVPAFALEAKGRVGVKLRIQVASVASLLLSLGCAGVLGASLRALATAWLCAEIVRHALYWRAMTRWLQVTFGEVARRYLFSATIAVVCGAPFVWQVRIVGADGIVGLLSAALVAVATSTVITLVWRPRAVFDDLTRLWRLRGEFNPRGLND